MADHRSSGPVGAGPNLLTFALLAGVLGAGGLILQDAVSRGSSRPGMLDPSFERQGGISQAPIQQAPVKNGKDHRADPAGEIPSSAPDALLDMSPELKSAFDVVLRGKTLLDGERPEDADSEKIREKASRELGYALHATPLEDVSQNPGGADLSGSAPWVITGKPEALDGASLRLNDLTIHLHGIRAPDDEDMCRNAGGQSYDCAAWSTEVLSAAIGGRNVSCDLVGSPDAGGAIQGWCHLHLAGRSAIDLAGWMVSAGAALATEDGLESYQDIQTQAQDERNGIWSGSLGLSEEPQSGEPR